MRRHLTCLASAALVMLLVASPSFGQNVLGKLKGSKHDLNTWGNGLVIPNSEICAPCHAAHNGNSELEEGRFLWNHQQSAKNFTLYTNKHTGTRFGSTSSANAVLDDGSKMCLSCHDGAVALDAFGGSTGTAGKVMTGDAAVGRDDLSNDHPVGIGYPGLSADGKTWNTTSGYFNPTDPTWGRPAGVEVAGGAAVKLAELPDGRMGIGCTTCHTPHSNKFKYLRMANDGSALCLRCHDK